MRAETTQFLSHLEVRAVDPSAALPQTGEVQGTEELRQDPAMVGAAEVETVGAGAGGPPPPPPRPQRPQKPKPQPVVRKVTAEGFDPNDMKTWGKVPRNAPCPCGSGRKFKQCHGKVA